MRKRKARAPACEPGSASFSRWAPLAAFLALVFVLKLIDFPALRLPTTRRGRWALAAIVVLMHGRVIANSVGVEPDSLAAVAVETVAVISAGAFLAIGSAP